MDYHADVNSYLKKLPADVPDDLIAFRSRSFLMCVPVPPWSIPNDLSQTTGLLAWGPDEHSDLGTFTWAEQETESHAT